MSSNKMDLKKTKKILSVLIVTAFILLVLGVTYWKPLLYICVALAVIYTAVYMKFWRCPHCGELLGRYGGTTCHHCDKDVGIKLRIP